MKRLILPGIALAFASLAACSGQQANSEGDVAQEKLPTLNSITSAGRSAADAILSQHNVEQVTNDHLELTGTQSNMIELGLNHANDPLKLARNNADMICRYELDYRRGIELGLIGHAGADYYGECATITSTLLK
ncbi:hypothetical protein EDC56_2740 [Sinobacterium caligoides]|uniref:Lipoprotein n=1 Tax=Sinobacterium caligoides TaxID=933926 RepID=A0A3N2DJW7_9GAMM|nr:hypothetical protein [Sinobacterium caligoides]ROS00104.1 hypothetical protein EDC56_2740 [Sinobacterium caligoides]